MSRRHLLVLPALTSLLAVCTAAPQAQVRPAISIADLLLKDEIQKAEGILQSAARSAETLAYQGEVEFRKGNFDKAQTLYQSSIQMNEKTGRAHFGVGKLALAKLNLKAAVASFKRAIELEPNEPLYRFYASEAAELDKNPLEGRKQLEEYIRLKPHDDDDRLTEAKAGLALHAAFGNKEIAVLDAPQQPVPIPFRKALNLIF